MPGPSTGLYRLCTWHSNVFFSFTLSPICAFPAFSPGCDWRVAVLLFNRSYISK